MASKGFGVVRVVPLLSTSFRNIFDLLLNDEFDTTGISGGRPCSANLRICSGLRKRFQQSFPTLAGIDRF